jgi:hypothetical protein
MRVTVADEPTRDTDPWFILTASILLRSLIMKPNALALASFLVIGACADQRAVTAPAARLTPGGRLNVGGPGGSLISESCTRTTGTPVEVTFTFTGTPGSSDSLRVVDNGELGLNGTITLNGEAVVTHPMLGGNGPVNLAVPVTLLPGVENVVICKLEGKPGSGLAFQVTQ